MLSGAWSPALRCGLAISSSWTGGAADPVPGSPPPMSCSRAEPAGLADVVAFVARRGTGIRRGDHAQPAGGCLLAEALGAPDPLPPVGPDWQTTASVARRVDTGSCRDSSGSGPLSRLADDAGERGDDVRAACRRGCGRPDGLRREPCVTTAASMRGSEPVRGPEPTVIRAVVDDVAERLGERGVLREQERLVADLAGLGPLAGRATTRR